MISREEARRRVAKGAAHLDHVKPGWFTKIDVGRLSLGRGCDCIVGQLGGGWTCEAIASLELQIFSSGLNLRLRDAGCLASSGQEYELLQDAWIEAIADRRLAAPETLVAVDPQVEALESSLRA